MRIAPRQWFSPDFVEALLRDLLRIALSPFLRTTEYVDLQF
jgi:hypothetical protein